ncbi:MAG: hypothetical protein R2762_10095 [Bryobacteraceae bacterium]
MNQQIREAAELFRDSPVLGDDELFEMLVLRGVERMLAARLVEFLPMVYCRILLRDGGATFPDVYYRIAGDEAPRFDMNSLTTGFGDDMEHAQKWSKAEAGRYPTDCTTWCGVSSCRASSRGQFCAENIAFAPMIFKWPEQGPPDVAVNEPKKPSGGPLERR